MRSDDTKAAVEGKDTGTRRPVGKDFEKGVVRRDDMKPDSGTLGSTTMAREVINGHDPERPLPRHNEEGMWTKFGKAGPTL
jgi:hypothetical protein